MERSTGGRAPGCVLGCAFFTLILLLLASLAGNGVMALALALGRGGFHGGFEEKEAVDEYPVLKEVWSYGEGDTRAVRIAVNGVISRYAEEGLLSSSVDMVETVIQEIRAAQADETIRAIILEIDSPGGGITPTDEIYRALEDFKASDDGRLILAYCTEVAASGGYYLASAADWIITEPTTMLGSISVIMQTLNWSVLSEKIGVTDVTITSGEHKDLLNPFQAVSTEERDILQTMVNGLHQHFLDVVCAGRHLEPEAVNPYADGRVFLPETALQAQLIDEIGYWDDVMVRCAEMLDVDSVKVIRYEYRRSFMDLLNDVRLRIIPQGMLHRGPRLLYLWNPAL